MGRGYWLPPSHENLAAYDGFYIDSNAVNKENQDHQRQKMLHKLCEK